MCVVTPLKRLVGMPKVPQNRAQKGAALHAGGVPITDRQGTLLLGVAEAYPLLQMHSGWSKLA